MIRTSFISISTSLLLDLHFTAKVTGKHIIKTTVDLGQSQIIDPLLEYLRSQYNPFENFGLVPDARASINGTRKRSGRLQKLPIQDSTTEVSGKLADNQSSQRRAESAMAQLAHQLGIAPVKRVSKTNQSVPFPTPHDMVDFLVFGGGNVFYCLFG